ncbi:MAG: 2OG-Fe(II) oxygenase [Bdellovibrionales bacterium]
MALEMSEKFKKILNDGSFQSLLSLDPWPHFILDELIPPEDFRRVQSRITKKNIEFSTIHDHPAKLQLSYMEDLELAEFFFSKEVRRLFEGIADCRLRPNPELAIQFRRMTPESPVFAPHIDLIEVPSLVALYYVASGWKKKKGGEIILLKDEFAELKASSSKWVAPVENRLLLFFSNDSHWHCVRKVTDWTRLMVLTEWLKVNEAANA